MVTSQITFAVLSPFSTFITLNLTLFGMFEFVPVALLISSLILPVKSEDNELRLLLLRHFSS